VGSGIVFCSKAGKLSPLGDSGIVSRNGVELPLVGGPHICGVNPSCAWISRALSFQISRHVMPFQKCDKPFRK
jgi:hypothetical protein